MAKAKNPIPEGFHTLTCHRTVNGAADYIDFLKRAFNAVEETRVQGPGGKLLHARVRIGDAYLMLNDTFPEFGSPEFGKGPWPSALHVYVADPDAAFAQATGAGCQVVMPLADQFWGDRYGLVTDPFGFNWSIASHIEDLTEAELEERQAKAFARGN
jgi:PhnB protein